MQQGNTTNTVLVLLLIVIVGFAVWYMTMHTKETAPEPAVELNLGDEGDMM